MVRQNQKSNSLYLKNIIYFVLLLFLLLRNAEKKSLLVCLI